jgi:hypothetical protein
LSASKFPISVRTRGGQTIVDVEYGLARHGLTHVVLRSSTRRAPHTANDHWPTGLGWSIDARLRSERATKGRVLAIWQDNPRPRTPVAALCWHLHESGPIYIFDAGCIDQVRDDEKIYMGFLLLCLRQIAGHRLIDRNKDVLRWSLVPFVRAPRSDQVALRRAAQERAERYGFTAFTGKRPAWTTRWWLGERRF